jgi:hypothetical protein
MFLCFAIHMYVVNRESAYGVKAANSNYTCP